MYLPIFLTLLGCGGSESTPMLEGSVSTADLTATIANSAAFGFHIDGVAYIYFASNPDTTCDEVVDYINHSQSSEAFDPTTVWLGGTCNLLLQLAGYEGDEHTFTGDENWIKGFWQMNCAMGDGEFVYETQNGYTDYYWSESVWTGISDVHDTTTTHVENTSYEITTEISGWSGNYTDQLGNVPLEGTVSGVVEAQWCSDLYQTGLWGS
jgi:hypothetical protein